MSFWAKYFPNYNENHHSFNCSFEIKTCAVSFSTLEQSLKKKSFLIGIVIPTPCHTFPMPISLFKDCLKIP